MAEDRVNMPALRRLVDNPDTYSWDDVALAAMPALPALLAVAEAARDVDATTEALRTFEESQERPDGWGETLLSLVDARLRAQDALRAALAKLQWEEP